jgi:hypothetical protein
LPHRTRLRPQVFSTSRRFRPPCACRPYFMPDPLMGLHPPELSPLAQPYAVSDASPLMPFLTKAPPVPVARRSTRQTIGSSKAPRLQGLAPRESPPLEHRWFRPAQSAWLSWAFHPPGLSPSMRCPGFHRGSPQVLGFHQTRTPDFCCTTGSHTHRDRLVSVKTAGPPGLCCLLVLTNVWLGRGSGVASSGTGVRHRPLPYHL